MKQPIAFITPYPPDQSGCAFYSFKTIEALAEFADIDVFTDCINPEAPNKVRAFYPIDSYKDNQTKYHKTIGVMGNSHFHDKIYNIMLSTPNMICINHDSRIVDYLFWKSLISKRQSIADFCLELSQQIKHNISPNELTYYIHNPTESPFLFFDALINSVEKFIVHSPKLKTRLENDYKKDVILLPFASMLNFYEDDFGENNINKIQKELGMSHDSFNIVTCGIVHSAKHPIDLIKAVKILNKAGVDTHLFFVGRLHPPDSYMKNHATGFGIGDKIHFYENFMPNEDYKKFILGADISVQLRSLGKGSYMLGQLSGAVTDCLAGGLRVLSNDSLASSFQSSEKLINIGNVVMDSVIFNKLFECYRNKNDVIKNDVTRQEYVKHYNFNVYAKQLMEIINA